MENEMSEEATKNLCNFFLLLYQVDKRLKKRKELALRIIKAIRFKVSSDNS